MVFLARVRLHGLASFSFWGCLHGIRCKVSGAQAGARLASTSSVVDLFEAVIPCVVTHVDKNGVKTHRVAVPGLGKGGSWRHLVYARARPTVFPFTPTGAYARRVGPDAVAIPVLALAELDMVDPCLPETFNLIKDKGYGKK